MSLPEDRNFHSLRSQEDQDILERSTKKTKRTKMLTKSDGMEGMEIRIGGQQNWPEGCEAVAEGGGSTEKANTSVSYKSMLIGREDTMKENMDVKTQ